MHNAILLSYVIQFVLANSSDYRIKYIILKIYVLLLHIVKSQHITAVVNADINVVMMHT